jgi:hypothetical protein
MSVNQSHASRAVASLTVATMNSCFKTLKDVALEPAILNVTSAKVDWGRMTRQKVLWSSSGDIPKVTVKLVRAGNFLAAC